VAYAARLRPTHHIGSLGVAQKTNGRRVPAGMITDRDVAVGVVSVEGGGSAAVRFELVTYECPKCWHKEMREFGPSQDE
jgi:hypothetical protein